MNVLMQLESMMLDTDVALVGEDDLEIVDSTLLRSAVNEFQNQSVCNVLHLGVHEFWKPVLHEHVSPLLQRATGRACLAHAYCLKRSAIQPLLKMWQWSIQMLQGGGDRRQFGLDVVWMFAPGAVFCVPDHACAVQRRDISDIEIIAPESSSAK